VQPGVAAEAPEARVPAVRELGVLAPGAGLGARVLEALPVREPEALVPGPPPVLEASGPSERPAALASKQVLQPAPAAPRLQALPATHGCTLRSEPCALRVETPL
jgi:hypothetical protein